MHPKIVTIFNNKGGVGKTTLTYHLAHALGEQGNNVLLMDLDPQCNLTIFALEMEKIHEIWEPEDRYVDDFDITRKADGEEALELMTDSPRSIHFTLKPTEDGTADLNKLPPPVRLSDNVDLLPGRLTLHLYEAKIGERWGGIYQGDPLAIRTATRVRQLAHEYAAANGYNIVIFDTSPSLGALNRNLLTLTDGFIIPCSPDLFSVYGIRNIGNALQIWKKQFDTIFQLLSDNKRNSFPDKFVKLMGYTLFNAKKYDGLNDLQLAKAHFHYAKQIPETIKNFIDSGITFDNDEYLNKSMGDNSIIHTHNTFPSMSQKYHRPMWQLPECGVLEAGDISTIAGNQEKYKATRDAYLTFAQDFMDRVKRL